MFDRSMLDNFEAAPATLSKAIAGLSREDLLAFPVPGTWSIQQIVLHLADTEQVFADRMKRVIAEDNPTLLSFDENLWASHLNYDGQSAQDACALLGLTRRQMACILRALPDSAFDRKGMHSVAGAMTLGELVAKDVKHLEHHLKFIIEKRQKLGKG
jgi:uncharacterized damage-inducible protein DinB